MSFIPQTSSVGSFVLYLLKDNMLLLCLKHSMNLVTNAFFFLFVSVVVVEIWDIQCGSYSSGYKDCQTGGSVCVLGFGQF